MAKSAQQEPLESNDQSMTSYDKWVEREGIPVIKTFFVEDIRNIKLEWWERKGGHGAFLQMEGAGQVNNCYICEIAPGKSLKPQRQLFEETIYVISGQGATTVWNRNDQKQTFEWQAGSLFSPPLNTWHQLFNGSGSQPARYLAVTTAPTMINLLHNLDFIFNNDFAFTDRLAARASYLTARERFMRACLVGTGWHVLETNFVLPDVQTTRHQERAGDSGSTCAVSCVHTACHISEFPVGTYKKAHRHGAGAHVIVLSGEGYSLVWPDGAPIKKYDWREGSMIVPPDNWWHQHFNAGDKPARYLALRAFGSKKYHGVRKKYQGATDRKKGGAQIEYQDEDPVVRQWFEDALGRIGIQTQMAKYYERS
jgi:quercetin dioxygenase-like cupin family protein